MTKKTGFSNCLIHFRIRLNPALIFRDYQIIKFMLRVHAFEFEKDWDEQVPLMLFAVWEVIKECLGISLN